MAYDRSEHLAVVKDREHERARAIMPLVKLVAAAAPVMDAVTRDENWNRYLSYLQGFIESFAKARDAARAKLGARAWTPDELQKLNADAMTAQATIDAFQIAIDLPRAIMDGKEEADRLVAHFERAEEKKNDKTASAS